MIHWDQIRVTEPPLTMTLTNGKLQNCIEVKLEFPAYPCHTQAVERAVILVSQASGAVGGHKSQKGFILNVQEARAKWQRLDTKSDHLDSNK